MHLWAHVDYPGATLLHHKCMQILLGTPLGVPQDTPSRKSVNAAYTAEGTDRHYGKGGIKSRECLLFQPLLCPFSIFDQARLLDLCGCRKPGSAPACGMGKYASDCLPNGGESLVTSKLLRRDLCRSVLSWICHVRKRSAMYIVPVTGIL